MIAQKVAAQSAAAKQYGGAVEMLFYLDACTDSTASLLKAFGSSVRIVESAEKSGKSVGMARLAERATGDILLFTDANTFPAPDALAEIARPFSDSDVGGVSARLLYSNGDTTEVARINDLYWKLEEHIKAAESATGSIMGADGGFFAVRRSLYTPSPPDIIDDMHTSFNVILNGKRFISCPSAIAYEKTATDRNDEFRRKVRIACRAFNCFRLLLPRFLRSSAEIRYKFVSHKLLRWLGLPLTVLGWFSLSLGLALIHLAWLGLVLVAALLGAALFGRLSIRPFSTFFEIGLAMLAVSIGMVESLRGGRYRTWSAAPSGR